MVVSIDRVVITSAICCLLFPDMSNSTHAVWGKQESHCLCQVSGPWDLYSAHKGKVLSEGDRRILMKTCRWITIMDSVPCHFEKFVSISKLFFPTFTNHVPLDWKPSFLQIHLHRVFICSSLFSIYFFLSDSTNYTQLSTLSTQSGWWIEHPACLFNPTGTPGTILVQQRGMDLTAKWQRVYP